MSAAFRSPDKVCSNRILPDKLGDRVVINPSFADYKHTVPLTQANATNEGYETGSCFASMGTHSFKDLTSTGMSWKANNLASVVPMYDRNAGWKLNAIFFTTPVVQQQMPNANQWEPIPLVNENMCRNWCDSGCGWEDTLAWSTFHLYFSDPSKVKCLGGCQIGCCE